MYFKNLTIILFLLLFSCGKSGDEFIKKWEGIRYNKLRVYTRLETTKDLDEKKIRKEIIEQLRILSKKRAVHLIINYVKSREKNPAMIENFNNKVRTILNKNKIVLFNYENESCEAIFDFNIKSINMEFKQVK